MTEPRQWTMPDIATYEVCPHDRETFERESVGSAYVCPECKARVCLDCRRHGWRDSMIPLVSWMSGTCDGCYRERETRRQIRKGYRDAKDRRERLRDAWSDGFEAGWAAQDPDDHAPNPHSEPGEHSDERWLLDKYDWLRAEVTQ